MQPCVGMTALWFAVTTLTNYMRGMVRRVHSNLASNKACPLPRCALITAGVAPQRTRGAKLDATVSDTMLHEQRGLLEDMDCSKLPYMRGV